MARPELCASRPATRGAERSHDESLGTGAVAGPIRLLNVTTVAVDEPLRASAAGWRRREDIDDRVVAVGR